MDVCLQISPLLYMDRAYATSRKVPRSIPGRVTGDFSKASDKSMCLGSTQPFEMSTRLFLRRAENLTTLMCRLSRNPGALTFRNPHGHVSLFRGYFTFTVHG
jgi:hypothetical protein